MKNNCEIRIRRGVTLVELILTLALVAIAIPIVYSILFTGNKTYEISKNIGFAQQDVRSIADVINSELRYIDNLKTVPLDGKYYSLEIKNNGDDTFYLEKKEYNEEDTLGVVVKVINGRWSKIVLDNSNTNGIINATIKQYEEEQKYSVDFEVTLENNRNLKWNIPIASDGENKIVYYSFPEDSLEEVVVIDDEDDMEEDPDEEDEEGSEIIPIGTSYRIVSKTKKGSDYEYTIEITVIFSDNKSFIHPNIILEFKKNKGSYPEFVIASVNGVSASGFQYTENVKIYYE